MWGECKGCDFTGMVWPLKYRHGDQWGSSFPLCISCRGRERRALKEMGCEDISVAGIKDRR